MYCTGDSSILPLFFKKFSNMSLFWSYLSLKLDFNKIKLYQMKLKKKKKKKNAWNSSSISIAAFKSSYSGVLYGIQAPWTRVPWTWVPCKKFDRPIPIATFRSSYSGVLYGTWAPWTRVPCFFFFFFLSLITPYSIFDKLSFTLKLDFEKIEFQNRGMNLNNFKTGIYC